MTKTSVTVQVNAPRERVYRAFVDKADVANWQVPTGMTSTVHEWDPRVGGKFRITLSYDEPSGTGKTTADADTFHGRFVELVPHERIVEALEFESENPDMRGEMTITIELVDLGSGRTEVRAVHDQLPRALSAEQNAEGWRISLGKLAKLLGS